MSANRKVLQRWFDSFEAGDYATTIDCMAEDVEYHELPGWPGTREGAVYRGREEVVAWYTELLGEWDGLVSEPGEITELDDGQVLVNETWRARGRQSGVDVEMRAASVFTIRDGRIARVRYFRTRDEALGAA
jgi:ketosteroid isomerase-like protein